MVYASDGGRMSVNEDAAVDEALSFVEKRPRGSRPCFPLDSRASVSF